MTPFEVLALPAGCLLAWAYVAVAARYSLRDTLLAAGLVVAALVYVVVAAWKGAGASVYFELAGALAFGALAVLGARKAALWLAVGWAAHALWDIAGQLATDPIMPLWYAVACLGFDGVVVAAVLLGPRMRQVPA